MCEDGNDMEKISNFYENTNIFVTGATGFLGKALVEKLLRKCDGISSIYLLIREKKGKTPQQRLEEFCKNPIFDLIRKDNPDVLRKMIAIPCDISLPNLGISNRDRSILVQNIHIVFHSAATIKFNEDFKTAVKLNVFGTQDVLKLCKIMKNLKSFVYVSTAYSNADKAEIDETVYEPPDGSQAILDKIDVISQDEIDAVLKKMLVTHPNTYTITKAMAEKVVLDNSNVIPSAIVRPSIGAWKEPYPGWIDSISGCTGVVMESGRGTIRTIICNGNCIADLIPVDIVINTIIISAWHTVTERSDVMRVYNCTSGTIKPITWNRMRELILKYSTKYPSIYVTWYPEFTYTMNRNVHALYIFLYHTIPSVILDVYLRCTKRKPMVLRLTRKIDTVLNGFRFFLTHQWKFKTSNMSALTEAVRRADDCSDFDLDAGKIDWDSYWKEYTIGIRKWLLKDEIDSLPQAKLKLNRLYWAHKICSLTRAAVILGAIITMLMYFSRYLL